MPPKPKKTSAAVPAVHPANEGDDMYLSDKSQANEDQPSVAAIVREVMAECPAAVLKFKVTDPEILAKDAKKREKAAAAKKKKTETLTQKRKAADASDNDEDNSDAVGTEENDKKKKKCNTPAESDDDLEEPIAIDLTMYVYVEKPPIPGKRGKLLDSDKYVQKGPFKLKSTESYSSFLVKISAALPCPVLNIVQEKMSWKCQIPQNSPSLPLGKELGYSAMLDTIKAKRVGSRVAIVMMPPPVKPAEQPHWDVDNSAKHPENGFDYAELEARSTEDSIAQQRTHFNQVVGPAVKQLEEKYPIGNHPRFPGKRVFTDSSTGWAWDLTDVRLNIWATHIVRNSATLDRPPESKHFDKSACITTPNAKHANEATPALTLAAPPPAAVAPAPAPSTNTADLIGLLLVGMLQQQQAAMVPKLAAPEAPVAVPAVPASSTIAPAPAVLIADSAIIPDISLDDFCARYRVDPKDRERLEKIEFRPGDDLDSLGPDEWKAFGGFAALSWARIKTKNQEFIRDVQLGKWKD
ncbi:hypothetical protein GALMADRAFT_102840 [Galerina marginata CBS 339.88]|uniref:Uncharacterized protein n=1 Tax=Galerina marginata (strain CBS 339.88) TaxID=685588 RepID=A0A067STV2_GALM3|nr:hypothetical protein GALMADRAFT_102840 [Galerina marginata CBS 339.88]